MHGAVKASPVQQAGQRIHQPGDIKDPVQLVEQLQRLQAVVCIQVLIAVAQNFCQHLLIHHGVIRNQDFWLYFHVLPLQKRKNAKKAPVCQRLTTHASHGVLLYYLYIFNRFSALVCDKISSFYHSPRCFSLFHDPSAA